MLQLNSFRLVACQGIQLLNPGSSFQVIFHDCFAHCKTTVSYRYKVGKEQRPVLTNVMGCQFTSASLATSELQKAMASFVQGRISGGPNQSQPLFFLYIASLIISSVFPTQLHHFCRRNSQELINSGLTKSFMEKPLLGFVTCSKVWPPPPAALSQHCSCMATGAQSGIQRPGVFAQAGGCSCCFLFCRSSLQHIPQRYTDTDRDKTLTVSHTGCPRQGLPSTCTQDSHKAQTQTAESPSSSRAGRDRSSQVAHTRHSPGSQAHTHSRIPGVTPWPPCPPSTAAWIPGPLTQFTGLWPCFSCCCRSCTCLPHDYPHHHLAWEYMLVPLYSWERIPTHFQQLEAEA